MRLRRRAVGLLGGALALFVVGTNVQAGMLFLLAALLLGALVAGIVFPVVGVRGLRAELVAPDEASQFEEAWVELRLHNEGRAVRWTLVVADGHLEEVEVAVLSVRPGERVELGTVRVPARRGIAETRTVTVRSAAPFGVAERRRDLPVTAATLVLPTVEPLGALSFVEPVATTEAGWHASPRRGHGPNYLGVREYRTGDSLRHVHWALTARHGQVMVREFEEERTRRLAILVDTERDTEGSPRPLDLACTVAASVMAAALSQGHGARILAATPAGDVDVIARADERAQLRWLARLEPSSAPLAEVAHRLGLADLRGVETLVAAFPAWDDLDAAAIGDALAALPVARVVAVPVAVGADPVASSAVDALVRFLLDVRPWDPGLPLADALGTTARADR